jgi:hypothetical protein
MAYQYLQEKVSPVNQKRFNSVNFWIPVFSSETMNIAFNNSKTPLFKVDIGQNYYFIFAALKTVNNIANIHVCVGHSILASFKVEFDYRTMSDTRKLILENDYNFEKLFMHFVDYPLFKVNASLKQVLSIKSRFDYAVSFKFNMSFTYASKLNRYLHVTVNYLEADKYNEVSSSVTSKMYTIYFFADADIAFEKQVESKSELGIRLARFTKFTQHQRIVVLSSLNQDMIYFVYELKGVLGIIQADLNAQVVLHTRYNTQLCSVTVITNIVDMDKAFFGSFNRYFGESLITYPSEHFIAFAEQYGLDIENVSSHDCLTLVDMVTV